MSADSPSQLQAFDHRVRQRTVKVPIAVLLPHLNLLPLDSIQDAPDLDDLLALLTLLSRKRAEQRLEVTIW
jgi:hypothetical protein